MRTGVWRIALGLALAGAPAGAQQFTTAAEVKPILMATQSAWVAVRDYDGRDFVYVTQVASWRCGLEALFVTINAGPEEAFPLEPCHEGEAQPNALKLEEFLPYLERPAGSVDRVALRLVFDDGSEERAEFARAAVLMP